MVCRKEAVL